MGILPEGSWKQQARYAYIYEAPFPYVQRHGLLLTAYLSPYLRPDTWRIILTHCHRSTYYMLCLALRWQKTPGGSTRSQARQQGGGAMYILRGALLGVMLLTQVAWAEEACFCLKDVHTITG